MNMNKKKLNQYKSLQKEIPLIRKKLNDLYERKEKIPVVMGKVQKSSLNFPYLEGHMPVEMFEPEESKAVQESIKINQERLEKAEADKLEIENFIASIQDSTDRLIFELIYQKGKTQKEVGVLLGYTEGRISQKISSVLKD